MSVLALDGLLDRDPARQSVRGGRENGHDPVSLVLDELTTVAGDRVGEQPVVAPAARVERVITKLGPQLGGADEIGEEDRARPRGHDLPFISHRSAVRYGSVPRASHGSLRTQSGRVSTSWAARTLARSGSAAPGPIDSRS